MSNLTFHNNLLTTYISMPSRLMQELIRINQKVNYNLSDLKRKCLISGSYFNCFDSFSIKVSEF